MACFVSVVPSTWSFQGLDPMPCFQHCPKTLFATRFYVREHHMKFPRKRNACLLSGSAIREGCTEIMNNVPSTRSVISASEFIQQVIQFLEGDEIVWRKFTEEEIRHVLESYARHRSDDISIDQVDELEALLQNRTILAVGLRPPGPTASSKNDLKSDNNHATLLPSYSFLLHLCPSLTLDEIQAAIYPVKQKQNEASHDGSRIANAVASYAWMNAHLTTALLNYQPKDIIGFSTNENKKPSMTTTTIVHLHQDVWRRSSNIVKSRLRSKCGIHANKNSDSIIQGRIYARRTEVKRISRAQYMPFLEENHLWGATGAKYGYGLFVKPKAKEMTKEDKNMILVAVATFSAKRKILRASRPFHSYELLRFCTKLDTTVVGGLTKLITAFLKDIPWITDTKQMKQKKKGVKGTTNVAPKVDENGQSFEVDIITSIDRDFGSNTWPDFERVEVMDPVPMFVGDIDGIRRHAVGAGLHPLEQSTKDVDAMNTSVLLRSGLPKTLLNELQFACSGNDDPDRAWKLAAKYGFCPVFDAGVERLIWVVGNKKKERHDGKDKYSSRNSFDELDVPPIKLWDVSFPRYVKKHYSPNPGVQEMIKFLRPDCKDSEI